ncbi:MAG: ribose transport system substrate-binding protein [Subtercola sp.]|nr:ribose transport system substrate-binding protein [Subtercola sp.]
MLSRRQAVIAKVAVFAAVSALALTACSSGGGSSDTASTGKSSYKIAVLLASSNNGYNQAVYTGVKNAVAASGVDVELQLLDGQFDSNVQLSQLQNAGTQGQVDGVIVVPNDGPGLAAAFPLANNIPVVTVLAPIGADIDEMQPQVEGVVSTVSVPPSDAATKQAEAVATYCADIDPCNTALLMGFLASPLDVARVAAYNAVLSQHSNIKVVATTEGGYDKDKSLTAMTNVLQANPNLNVVLSNADQDSAGAEIALENAGIDMSKVYLTGGGGTTYAVAGVKSGKWAADYVNFPVSMGAAALDQVINSLSGKTVTAWVDADKVNPDGVEPYATKETLAKTPDFTGEWDG